MGEYGQAVHMERIVTGNASSAEDLTIYISGTTTEYTLQADEHVVITDVLIMSEAGGDVKLLADDESGGEYIVWGNLDAKDSLERSFHTPYVCPKGVVPEFMGGNNQGLEACICEGYITV